jgi:hypothetical protein
MRRVPMIAIVLLAATCANQESSAKDASLVFCINDKLRASTIKTKPPCFPNERPASQQEVTQLMRADVDPRTGVRIPHFVLHCFDPDGNEVYIRDGGCYWGDYQITDAEFVAFVETQQPPASIAEREKKWVYCLDPKLDMVYAQELTPCSPGDHAIDRAAYLDHIGHTH